MAFNPMEGGGGGSNDPWCNSCRTSITPRQRGVRLHFDNDPHGHKGLSGLYHDVCGKRFASLARVINTNWSGRF